MSGEPGLSAADAQYVSDLLDRSITLHERGEWQPALRLAGEVLERLRRCDAHDAEVDTCAATAHQVSAGCLGELGLIDRAVEHYHLAEALLIPRLEFRKQLTQLMHNLAVLLADNGMTDAAMATIEQSRGYARDAGGQYAQVFDEFAQGLAWANSDDLAAGDDSLGDIEAARRRVRAAAPSAEWATDATNLGGRLLVRASADDVAEAERLLCAALAWARDAGRWPMYARMFSMFRQAIKRPVTLGPLTVAEVTQALGVLRHLSNPTDQGVVCETAAVLLVTQPVLAPLRPKALQLALRAIVHHDCAALAVRATVLRGMLSSDAGDVARSVALTIAADSGDRGLFVELLESSRLQVRPAERADESDVLAGMGSVGLSPIQPIAAGVPSRLRAYYPPGIAEPEDADLFDLIDAVGGPGSWWWGANVIDARYFWAVIAPDRTIEVGYRDLDDAEFTLLQDLSIEAVSGERDLTPRPARSRPLQWLTASFDVEERRSLTLGALLLPPPLREALWRGTGDRPTPSLVVAGAVLAAVPSALVAARDDQGRVRRLLERAVIRWAATAPIVRTAVGHPRYFAERYPVGVACLDPRGDLAYAAAATGTFEVTLRHSSRLHPPGDPRECAATAAGLAAALQHLGPSVPAIFFYSGHSLSGVAGIDAALGMQDRPLTAADILFGGPDHPPVPMPSRVLFSSCSSGGATGAGRGEWLGLSTACLLGGARSVLGTAWPIPDTPSTLRLEEDLLHRICAGEDPATALRACQLTRLAAWRSDSGGFPDARESPVVWASFQCIGVY